MSIAVRRREAERGGGTRDELVRPAEDVLGGPGHRQDPAQGNCRTRDAPHVRRVFKDALKAMTDKTSR